MKVIWSAAENDVLFGAQKIKKCALVKEGSKDKLCLTQKFA